MNKEYAKEVLEIKDNVVKFIDKCSKEIARHKEDEFNQELYFHCSEEIQSPIEQILYCALRTVASLNYIDLAEPYYIENKNKWVIRGLGISLQEKIGNYRCDFKISWNAHNLEKEKSVIIECDSQEFHERTEKERRYEKARDRFLQAQGYKIFHYTGTEIMKNALDIAREIIAFVMERNKEELIINSNME